MTICSLATQKSSPGKAGTYRVPRPVRDSLLLPGGDVYPICPRCSRSLDREFLTFCDRCGQRLSWKSYFPYPRRESAAGKKNKKRTLPIR